MVKEGTKMKKSGVLIALSSANRAFEFRNPLQKRVKYQGKYVDIKLREDPDGFSYIVWKNKKYMLDVIEKNQNRYTIMINGVWYSFTVETPFSFKRRKRLDKEGNSSARVAIEAPMPGKIIEILVEEGADVKEGEPILILEAMKMQNEIASHVKGTVRSVSVKKNDTVMKDDVLMDIQIS
ncbi:MAG TPA: acetyl-CoA carboxylase biotin carboxyl carrier protein subunit [Bacteroides sp.]|nr:acetyl-CoA carboxylase biotin carboxyl carrier protein subunit [Bacteroides sp.]